MVFKMFEYSPAARVAVHGFSPRNDDVPAWLEKILVEELGAELSYDDPEFVIFSVFGDRVLHYPDAIRIFVTGENLRADFNICDYAFGFDRMVFGDRYFRHPNFASGPQWVDLLNRQSSCLTSLDGKEHFCNFIYSNAEADPMRDRIFHEINAAKHVDSIGRHLKNSAVPIEDRFFEDWGAAKVETQRSFKFSIAAENSSTPGYTTEKLVHALAADTIPIYWGDPEVSVDFNPDRLIDLGRMSLKEAIERILYLDRDDDAFLDMVNKPFFNDPAIGERYGREAFRDQLGAILARGRPAAFRRSRVMWTRTYEEKKIRHLESHARLQRWRRRLNPRKVLRRLAR